jgi:methyl-accepting chemotaxis protein
MDEASVHIQNRSDVLANVDQAAINFLSQIQEWKNILIRGNDPEKFEQYLNGFIAREKNVQEHLKQGLVLQKQEGESASDFESLIKEHEQLGKNYREALAEFDADAGDAGKKVDKLVSGMDREASRQMVELASKISASFSQYLKDSDAKTNSLYAQSLRKLIIICITASLVIIAIMAFIFRDLFNVLGGEPAYTASVVGQVAEGDLSINIALKPGDKTSLLAAVKHMCERLSEIISDVRSSADALSSAAEEVNATAQSLAKGASVQASSVEETSASMEEMSSSIEQNNENSAWRSS